MGSESHDVIRICSDPVLKHRLEQGGLKAQVFDAVLTRQENIRMLESFEHFCSQWFLRQDESDYTVYRQVSIGASLHDEAMVLFYLALTFIRVIDTLKDKGPIVFYHSTSCSMPEPVLDFLASAGVKTELLDEQYPWISFKEQYGRQALSNFSRISFTLGSAGAEQSRHLLGQVKLLLKQKFSRLVSALSIHPQRGIYFHAHRSLIPFFKEYVNRGKNGYRLFITDTTPLEPAADKKKLSFFNDLRMLGRLARKGVVLDSLKCPFFYAWYVPYEKRPEYCRFAGAFLESFDAHTIEQLGIRDQAKCEWFMRAFRDFYLKHLVDFMKLIDFYFEKFWRLKVQMCLQEMCHPFQAQVLAALGIRCFVYPSNHILHNQYFAPEFFKRVGPFIRPVAFSDLDAQRYVGLGFEKKVIAKTNAASFRHWTQKVRPIHRIASLKGSRVLIMAPSIIALHTFRYQVQSEKLLEFFADVFAVLSEVGVASVTIRPHPGAKVARNRYGYTDEDILRYAADRAASGGVNFELRFSDSYLHNLEHDILAHDIAIGNITGALFELLVMGRDFICFDSTVTPFYGTKDWSLFNEGTVKSVRTRVELRDYLSAYSAPDLERLRARLLGSAEEAASRESFDPAGQLEAV